MSTAVKPICNRDIYRFVIELARTNSTHEPNKYSYRGMTMIQIATFMEFIKSHRNAATSLEYDLIAGVIVAAIATVSPAFLIACCEFQGTVQ
jgi:Flp pilus assembly pilin Flp